PLPIAWVTADAAYGQEWRTARAVPRQRADNPSRTHRKARATELSTNNTQISRTPTPADAAG
ncbi:hypothetical protein ABZ302_43790, partial [Streptomyces sp. NPDC006237]|uniref:hypothetical protein n=1 Tax=Streptomyces sp. NPDC006237 TaxID=3154474 RepID=UPI00339EF1C1